MMTRPYPYCLVGVDIKPIFGELQKGAPFYLSLGTDSPYRAEFEDKLQTDFNEAVFQQIYQENHVSWSVGGYLEDRSIILKRYPQMIEEKRYYHLGLDLNFPKHTPIYAPIKAEVVQSQYEEGEGNYGGLVVLKCCENGTTFYLVFGHLERAGLPEVGRILVAGEQFARVGDFDENGAWYHHIHLQVLTEKAYREGWVNKGYCTLEDIPLLDQYAPDPTVFLWVSD